MITLPNGVPSGIDLSSTLTTPNVTSLQPPVAAPAPNAAQVGQDSLSGDVGQLPTGAVGLSFAQKMAQAADKLGIPAKADGTPQPGGWAKSLVAAAQSALAGVGNVGQVPPGAGALYGVGKAMQYQQEQKQQAQKRQDDLAQQAKLNARQDQEAADAHQLAQLNIQKYHQEVLDHSLNQDKSFADSKAANEEKQLKMYTDAGATVLHNGLDSDEVQSELAKQGIKTWQDHVFADGVKEYEKPDGTMGWRNTYSVISGAPNVTVDKDNADFINKWAPQNVPVQEGQALTGLQGRNLLQQANNAASFFNAVKKTREDADIEAMTDEQRDEALRLAKDPAMTAIAASTKGNPLDVIAAAQANPTLQKQYPTLGADLKSVYFGDKEDVTGNKGYNDAIKDREDNRTKLEEKRIAAAQTVAQVGGAMTPELQKQISNLSADQQKFLSGFPPDQQGSLLAVAYGPGDLDFDKIFPARLYKGQAGISSQQAIRDIRELNKNWSMQQYKQTSAAYKDATTGNSGDQVAQYNNVLEHSARAVDVINHISQMEGKNAPRIMRTALNKIANQGYGTEIAELNAALQPVKDEFGALLANGYKATEEQSKAYNGMLSGDATPEQLGVVLKVVGATGAIRLENINEKYKRLAGKNLPGILTQDTMDDAKHVNLDPTSMGRLSKLDVGGTLFHNENWEPPTQAELVQSQADKQATEQAQQVAQNVTPPANAQKVVKDAKGNIIGYAVPGPNGGLMFQAAQGK